MANCRLSLTVVGFARRDKSDDEFRKELEEAVRQIFATNGSR